MKNHRLALSAMVSLLASFSALTLALNCPAAEKKPAAEQKPDPGKKDQAGKKDEAKGDEEPVEKARTVAEIEKDMKKAQLGQNFAGLWTLVQEAVELKDPAAYKAVITYALRGEDRDLELNVFKLLIKLEDPKFLPIACQEATKNGNFKTRIILLAVCFQKRADPAAFTVLADALKDRHQKVALRAVKWLRESKDPDRAVPALIESLEKVERASHGRLYFDILNSLKELTGEVRELAADWKTYWDSTKNGKPSKPREQKTVVRLPSFFSVPIESDRILFIIDISGSMTKRDPGMPEEEPKKAPEPPSGKTVVRKDPKTVARENEEKAAKKNAEPGADRERIVRVKKELVKLIGALPQNVNFTVMSYNHQIAFIGDAPRLMMATPENKKRAEAWVNALVANGETWTDTAFEKAMTDLSEVDTIYLLSDGMPYRNGATIDKEKVREGIKVQNRFAVARVHTFGFVQEGMNLQRFLMAVAADNDGKYTALK